MRFLLYSIILLALLGQSACIKVINSKGQDPGGFEKYDKITSRDRLLNLHATPFFLYAASRDQFFTLDGNNNSVETRNLNYDKEIFGRTAISDNSFMRLVKASGTNDQIMEFHLTKVAGQIVNVRLNDLLNPGESALIDYNGWTPGCYSSDGEQFLVPAVVLPDYTYSFFLFELDFNGNTTELYSVDLVGRFEAPNLSLGNGNISATRNVGGNFYVLAQSGTWKVNPEDSTVTQLNGNWTIDCFKRSDSLYLTGYDDFNFLVSGNNGQTWNSAGRPTDMRFVTQVDTLFVSQNFIGQPYNLPSNNLQTVTPVAISSDLNDVPDSYYGIAKFKNRVYLTHGKSLYFTENFRSN